MALIITNIEREFKMKKSGNPTTLADPNPALTPEEVLSFYSNAHPELTTATVAPMKMENDKAVFEFVTTVGTKG
ncbi:MAG: PRTRC system protein C [Legionellaceae bacterium]|nr:PRTRC system protein C [Legionellaceae bacterium]